MSRGWLQFGPFLFDPLSLELRRAGRKIRLRPQSARALALLLEAPGNEVSREALRAHLWGDGTYVDYETGLNTCIRRLRNVLADDARRPRFVLTLPGHGYRFIMPVTVPPEAPNTTTRATEPGQAADNGHLAASLPQEASPDQDVGLESEDIPHSGIGEAPTSGIEPESQAISISDRPNRLREKPDSQTWRARIAWALTLITCVLALFSLAGGWQANDLAASDAQAATNAGGDSIGSRFASPGTLVATNTDPGPGILVPTPPPAACPSPSSRPIFAIVAKVEGLEEEDGIGRALVTKFRRGLKQSTHLQLMPGPRFRTGLARLTAEHGGGRPNRSHILRLGRVERADAVILVRVSRSPFPGDADLFFEVEIIDLATQSLVFDRQVAGETAAVLAPRVEQTVRQATRALHDLAPRW